MKLDPKDVTISTFRPASGSMIVGMDSGVRATHLPTGLYVVCAAERSQHRNKQQALEELEQKVAAHYKQQPEEPVVAGGMPVRRLTKEELEPIWNKISHEIYYETLVTIATEIQDRLFAQTGLPLHTERVGIELTPEELMLLLQVYVGKLGPGDQYNISHMKTLLKHGLVAFTGIVTVTPKGVARVKETLQ